MSRRTRPYSELKRTPGKKPAEKAHVPDKAAKPRLKAERQEGLLWDWARKYDKE